MALTTSAANAQNRVNAAANSAKPEDTEQWEPVPPIVTPGAADNAPPSDAIVLFDGKNLDQWIMADDHSPARWRVENGAMVVDKAERPSAN